MSFLEYNLLFTPIQAKILLYFNVEEEQQAQLQILDILGKTVKQVNITEGRGRSINTQSMQQGIYIYRLLSNGEKLFTGKLIVE